MEVYAYTEEILKQYCYKFRTRFRTTRVLVQDDTGGWVQGDAFTRARDGTRGV
jgi:hypothetical protein